MKMKKIKFISTACLLYIIILLMTSSLMIGFIFSSSWREDLPRHYSNAIHLPQGIFRELLSDRHISPLYKTHENPDIISKDNFSVMGSKKKVRPENVHLPFQKSNNFEGKEYMHSKMVKGNSDFIKLNSSVKTGWIVTSENVTIHIGNVSNPHNYSYVINPKHRCQDFDEHRTKLLIFIESYAMNFERRQAIRETWGLLALQTALNFRIIFLLGLSNSQLIQNRILKESYRYGDIVQESFVESFHNLALKSVMGLKWSISYCYKVDYVMKTDDDLLIHVPNLLKILRRYPLNYQNLICHENRIRTIIRSELKQRVPLSYGKYIVGHQDLPGIYFPPYCAGMGYIFSMHVARKLYETSLVTPLFFIEDAYITGFCRQKAGLSLVDNVAITLKPIILPEQGGCAFKDGRITSQEINFTQMREIWNEINTQGYFCPKIIGFIN